MKCLLYIFLVSVLTGCGYHTIQTGKASYYADKFQGRKTSSGEIFSQRKKTAAHPTLPFGTKLKVTNESNGKSVKVRINDRGPFVANRIIDLSKKAAQKIGMVEKGVVNVSLKSRKKK